MNRPRVSCVLPTYNGSQYLRESICSVLAQTERDFELIVVDDCSTDETPTIINEFAQRDPRIRPLRNAVNKKLPASLNVGFAVADGRYFTWTSDDNLYEPKAFAVMADALDSDPNVGLVYSDYRSIDDQGRLCGDCRVPEIDRLVTANCVKASFLYRREVHDALSGYREDYFLTEDYDFWLRASKQFRFSTVQEFLYRYRSHPGSLSETRLAEIERATLRLLEEHLPTLTWPTRNALALAFLYQADRAVRAGHSRQALLYALMGVRKSPYGAWRGLKELLHGPYRRWKKRRSALRRIS